MLRLADSVDISTYGPPDHPTTALDPADGRLRSTSPATGFTGRITDDGEFTARPFRYHVYGACHCPWSHQLAVVRELAGLHDLVTMSYVDGDCDGRGWAFRARYGPDPVNGFTLLRQAYEATVDGFQGPAAVPVLWDRFHARVVSNDATGIGIDLATRFRHLADGADLYPAALRDRIDEVDRWLRPAVSEGVYAARRPGRERDVLLDAFELLDARLSGERHLLGDALTLADVRLWVTLVRYDAGPNAHREINPGLHVYPHLWRYARSLYRLPAFGTTTDFTAFTRPGATPGDWDLR